MSLVLSSGNCFRISCPGRTVHNSMGIMAPRPTWRVVSLLNQINRDSCTSIQGRLGNLKRILRLWKYASTDMVTPSLVVNVKACADWRESFLITWTRFLAYVVSTRTPVMKRWRRTRSRSGMLARSAGLLRLKNSRQRSTSFMALYMTPVDMSMFTYNLFWEGRSDWK